MPNDYYQTLELYRKSSEADLKKAYSTLALKYQPDCNLGGKGAEENFKEIN